MSRSDLQHRSRPASSSSKLPGNGPSRCRGRAVYELRDVPAEQESPRDRVRPFGRALEEEVFGFHPERRFATTKHHGIDPAPFTLLWTGWVSHDNNIDFLLDRYRDMGKRSGDIQLVLAGDGPALDHYRQITRELVGVHWLGHLPRETLHDWYSAADLLVFPGTSDTLDMAVLEAHASGLPAIVTDIGGHREIVDNGNTGYVLSLADPKAWTQHICTLVSSKRINPVGWDNKRREIVRVTASRNLLEAALAKLELPAPERASGKEAAEPNGDRGGPQRVETSIRG